MRKRHIGVSTICGILLAALLLLMLIPALMVGQYDRMCCDDYDYSKYTRSTVVQDGSLNAVLSTALDTVSEIYYTWQGTYSAVFLFSLQPGIWGQAWYMITPVLLLGSLIAGLGYFLYGVVRRVLGSGRSEWLVTWMIAAILCLQFPRDAREGFYWYNSGILYTFFYSFMLIWLGLALDTMFRKDLSRGKLVLRGTILVLLSAVIAGGNYPTVLLFGLALLSGTVWSAWKQRTMLPVFLAAVAVFAVGFLFSVLAPGNAFRLAKVESLGPVSAVLSALVGTPKRVLGQLLRHPGIVGIILAVWVPFCIAALHNNRMRFRMPLLMPVASWLILAAMFTPAYYAMGYSGPYRLWNIVIFTFYLLLLWNIYYFAGWWKRRFPAQYTAALGFLMRGKRWAPACLTVVVCASILLSGVGPSLGLERESAMSVRATAALAGDETGRYAKEFDVLTRQIESTQTETVDVYPIIEPDSLIPDGDLTDYLRISKEPDAWFGKTLNPVTEQPG